MIVTPATFDEAQQCVMENRSIRVRGAGTKSVLQTQNGVAVLDMRNIGGVGEYEPSEFTVTAYAGTPIAELRRRLAVHGQYLPFDPVLVDAGATLGGTIASGINGPCRLLYGGMRDFLIGIRFIDGLGKLVRGGGKVVKNAAGFDFPKWMAGSMGRFGVIVEATLKVFPSPTAWRTLFIECKDIIDAENTQRQLIHSVPELEALDLEPPNRLIARIAANERGLTTRLEQLRTRLQREWREASDDEDVAYWRGIREFEWMEEGCMPVKVPIAPARIAEIDEGLRKTGLNRRYSVGGNLVWFCWPCQKSLDELDVRLRALGLSGVAFNSPSDRIQFGERRGESFLRRVKQALDPERRFLEW